MKPIKKQKKKTKLDKLIEDSKQFSRKEFIKVIKKSEKAACEYVIKECKLLRQILKELERINKGK